MIFRLMKVMVIYYMVTIDYCRAQTFTTPEVSSFKQEAFRPVSYYTGQANISIPLTTVQTKEITIPITLNYVGGEGLRPINPYSSAGMGWRVSAGGAISRSKNGICDEFTIAVNQGVVNGFFSLAPNTVTNSDVRNNVSTYVATDANGQYFSEDTEYSPDVFSFSFLGYSGYFLMGYDGQFKIQSQDIASVKKVDNISWPGVGHTIAFELTANDGTVFSFGGTTGSMELSGGNGPGIPYQCDAWYLTEIKSVNGRVVTFNYQPNDQTFVRYTASEASGNLLSNDNESKDSTVVETESTESVNSVLAGSVLANSPVVLANIVFNGGRVLFTSSVVDQYIVGSVSNPRMIDKIELQDSDNTVVSSSNFTYSDWNEQRYYFLDVLVVDGKSYAFGYHNRSGLPSVGTYLGTDYWGFYNGGLEVGSVGTGNVSSFWDMYLNPTVTYAPREPVLENTKCGILTSITYPTGGVESYEYELNTYSYKGVQGASGTTYTFLNSEAPKAAGGLRVAKITLGDMVRKYKYVNSFDPNNPDYIPGSMSFINYLSSGILYRLPGVPYFGRSAANALSIDGEPPVVYAKVIEFLADKSYTEYTMRSPLDKPDRDNTSSTAYYSNWFSNAGITTYHASKGFVGSLGKSSSSSLERGQISAMNVYDGANVLKKSVAYTYATDPNRFNQNVAVVNIVSTAEPAMNQLGHEMGLAYFSSGIFFSVIHSYEVYTFPVYLEKEVEISYESGGSIQKTTQYVYNSQKLRSEISFTSSTGKSIKTKIKYPADVNTGIYATMVAKKMLNFPIEQVQLVNTQVAGALLNTYKSNMNGSITYYVPDKKYRLEITAPVAESGFTSFNGTAKDSRYGAAPEISFDSYSYYGNVRQTTTHDGIVTSYLYDGSGVYPMAQVKGTAYSSISAEDGKSASYSSSTLFSSIKAITPTALINTYSYKRLVGISEMTDPAGKSTLYDYDGLGRLIAIKDGANRVKASYCYNYAGQATPCADLAPEGSIAAPGLSLIGISPPLPVTLAEFEAVRAENTSLLTWATTSEANSERFDVERSGDGKTWSKLGEVPAEGESGALQHYSFTDNNPLSGRTIVTENLYRLKMVDHDGSFAYSRIKSVTFGQNGETFFSPNPITVGDKLILSTGNLDKITAIKFFDSAGRLALQTTASRDINTSTLASGLYIVQVTFTDGSNSTHRIVKQ